jgi:hypothetical protein
MKRSIFGLIVVGVIAVALALLLSSCSDYSSTLQPEPEYDFNYARGAVRLWADYDMVFLPGKVSALYFDTTYSYMTIHQAPKWQFIGRLKIDSLVRDGKVEPMVNADQLTGVIIAPEALRDCLAEHKVYLLGRRIPRAVPYDTLYWDDIRQRWWILPDLSMHFRISFDKNRSIRQTIESLGRVGRLANLGPIEIPTPD